MDLFEFSLSHPFFPSKKDDSPQNIAFHKGMWSGVMGKSGSGKTTLLRYIAKSIPLSFYTCQKDRLLPWLSTLHNVMLLGKIQGPVSRQNRDRAVEILTNFGLFHVLHAYPHTLSYGMQTRVLLARALWMEADVYLLDEVFNGLDAGTKNEVMEITQKMLCGKTVLFVSHNGAEIQRFCKDIYLIDQGVISLQGCKKA